MYYTFQRCDKRTFDRAFADGTPVTMVKDPSFANSVGSTFVTRGFTRETVTDPYADGPSRAGERWFYWVADLESATPVGPVEYVAAREVGALDGWGFRCECGDAQSSSLRGLADKLRDGHAAWHAANDRKTSDPHDVRCAECGSELLRASDGYSHIPVLLGARKHPARPALVSA